MEQNDKYWKKLEAYSEGALTTDERLELEKWLSTNEDAQVALSGFKKVQKKFPDKGERTGYFDEQSANIVQLVQTENRRKKTSIVWVAASILVLFALGIAIGINTSSDKSTNQKLEELVTLYSTEFYSAPFKTRDPDSETPKWVELYQSKSFREVVDHLKSKKLSAKEVFYLAMSHFYLQEYNSAIELYNDSTLEGTLYEEQRDWFLALALIDIKQENEAKNLLKSIINNRTFKYKNAQELLVNY